jgi:uncharacterized alpha-E superfamily protein
MLSRVANSLYWMSRYLERAEHTARVIDVNLVLMLDQAPVYAGQRWDRLLRSLRADQPEQTTDDPQKIAQALIFDRSLPLSIVSMLTTARDNARQVRNQLSSEMWEQINRLYLEVNGSVTDDIWDGRTHALFRSVKEGVQLFHGITDATMRQDEGWHFLRVGRFLERANATIALLDAYFGDRAASEQPDIRHDYLDWVSLLKSRTAFEAYCQVYTADLQPERIAAFMLLNLEFPHSVRFAAARMHVALSTLARLTNARKSAQIERVAGRLHATFDYTQIEEIMSSDLHAFLQDVQRQCEQLHTLLHEVYFQPPIDAVLAS